MWLMKFGGQIYEHITPAHTGFWCKKKKKQKKKKPQNI